MEKDVHELMKHRTMFQWKNVGDCGGTTRAGPLRLRHSTKEDVLTEWRRRCASRPSVKTERLDKVRQEHGTTVLEGKHRNSPKHRYDSPSIIGCLFDTDEANWLMALPSQLDLPASDE